MAEREKLGPAYRGSNRSGRLPCCGVDVEDIRRLYRALQARNDAIGDNIVRGYKEDPAQSRADFEKNVRFNLRVTVVATGRAGEQNVTHDIAGLDEEHLPSVVVEVMLDTAWLARGVMQGKNPANWCVVVFDFRRPPLIDFSNASGEPTPNGSNYQVVADDPAWGAAVAEEIQKELSRRTLWRRWLHGSHTYDALLVLLGFPLALWSSWRMYVAAHLQARFGESGVGVLIVIYLFMVALYLFRGAFGAARWLWPYVELQRERQSGLARSARVVVGVIYLGLVSAAIYDVLKSVAERGK